MILEELKDEMRWNKKFANSQDALAFLASEAMNDTKSDYQRLLIKIGNRHSCNRQ
jgi:hypothetical protein